MSNVDQQRANESIAGKQIEGGVPANLEFIRFNFALNVWEFVPVAAGEANLGANVGAGTGLVFRDKTGVTLNFKTLIAGAGITINNNANDIEIIAAGGGGLGDLEFLRDKQLSGDLIEVTGTSLAAAPVTIISITPAAGKTLFLAGGAVTLHNQTGGFTTGTCDLENDGTAIDSFNSASLNPQVAIVYNSPSRGSGLIGNGARLFRWQKTLGVVNCRFTGTILAWIQDT